jgi:hypothetical protein
MIGVICSGGSGVFVCLWRKRNNGGESTKFPAVAVGFNPDVCHPALA